MFYLRAGAVTLVGASPEIMCRVENGLITNRPLAGTRRRGATPDEDRALADELINDPKERAEHIMLVDLGSQRRGPRRRNRQREDQRLAHGRALQPRHAPLQHRDRPACSRN